MIKAVLFDFDNTLGNREVYAYDCYRDLVMKQYPEKDPVETEAIVQAAMLADEQGITNKAYVNEVIRKKYGRPLFQYDPNEEWSHLLHHYTVLFDDAMETILTLKKKYLLGIITNGTSHGQHNKIRKAGIEDLMDVIVVSDDVKVSKPDPKIFEITAEKLGVLPEECVYVGDIYSSDVIGSYRAGMHPVWIWVFGNRKNTSPIPQISRISELIELLEKGLR